MTVMRHLKAVSTFYATETIQEGLPRLLGIIDTGGIFADRLLGAILGLPAINLSTSFLLSPKAVPGEFAIIRGIEPWPANIGFQ